MLLRMSSDELTIRCVMSRTLRFLDPRFEAPNALISQTCSIPFALQALQVIPIPATEATLGLTPRRERGQWGQAALRLAGLSCEVPLYIRPAGLAPVPLQAGALPEEACGRLGCGRPPTPG